MKSANGKNREGRSLEDDDHWEVKQRFGEESQDEDNRTGEWLELFRNEVNLHVYHIFVAFKRRGGRLADMDVMNGSEGWPARLDSWISFVERCFTGGR